MTTQRSHGSKPRVASLSRWAWEQSEGQDRPPLDRLLAEAAALRTVREFGITHGYVWFTAAAGPTARALCAAVDVLLPGWQRAKDGAA